MSYPEITYQKEKALSLNDFREMDYHAVEHFSLPIELMMENTGLHYNQDFEILPGLSTVQCWRAYLLKIFMVALSLALLLGIDAIKKIFSNY